MQKRCSFAGQTSGFSKREYPGSISRWLVYVSAPAHIVLPPFHLGSFGGIRSPIGPQVIPVDTAVFPWCPVEIGPSQMPRKVQKVNIPTGRFAVYPAFSGSPNTLASYDEELLAEIRAPIMYQVF